MNQRLDNLKNALHLEWGELADRIGISRSMLDQVRKGKRSFGPKTERAVLHLEDQAGLIAKPDEWNDPDEGSVREGRAEYKTSEAEHELRKIKDELGKLMNRIDRVLGEGD